VATLGQGKARTVQEHVKVMSWCGMGVGQFEVRKGQRNGNTWSVQDHVVTARKARSKAWPYRHVKGTARAISDQVKGRSRSGQ
jgi:hypothetical protein